MTHDELVAEFSEYRRKTDAKIRQLTAQLSGLTNSSQAPVINVQNPRPERCAWDFHTDADGVTHATPKPIT